jgi:hypothetical protein
LVLVQSIPAKPCSTLRINLHFISFLFSLP